MNKCISTLFALACFMAAFSSLAFGQLQSAEDLEALNAQIAHLYKQGKYTEAISIAEKMRFLAEKKYGPDQVETAAILNTLAMLYDAVGRYNEAEPLYKKSIKITEDRLGNDHQYVSLALNNLAELYRKTGRYLEAEPLYERSLRIKETKLGEDHLEVSITLNNLAALYRETSRYAEAEPLYKRSLKIREVKLPKDNLAIAISLNNLAGLYKTIGLYNDAEPLYKRALEIREAKLNKDHPDVAQSLNNLAELYRVTGRYAEAEPLYIRSLSITEARPDENDLNVAKVLNNLAGLYQDTGRYAEAEPLYKRSLEIKESKLGRDHPDVASSLSNLAVLYATSANYDLSRKYLYQSINVREDKKESVFLLLDEKHKLLYALEKRSSIESLLTLTSRHLQKDNDAVQDTLSAWLRWKGAVTESQGRLTEACTRSEDTSVLKKCDELNNVRRTFASLSNSKPAQMDFESYRKTLADYEGKKSNLEAELSRLSKDFALEKLVGKADIPAIASILPKNSAYLDFAVIAPFDFKQKRFEEKPRCLVFVLLPGDSPRVVVVDLGYTEAIDRRIGEYHKVIQEAVGRKRPPAIDVLRGHLKALYGLVMEPLMPYIQGRKQLFVSPDGSLNLIPFEAFITPEGKYLVGEHSIQYVAAGRDIVRFKDEARAQGKALILADPDYDLGESERVVVAKQMGVSEVEIRGGPSRDAGGLSFKRLPDTRKEAETIRKTMMPGEATCREGKEALQEVLFAAQYPKVLHIATHGYFLPDQKITPQLGPGRDILPPEVLKAYENPMLRSGIALAGANTSQRQGKDYGMVSAEKVLGLKLKGTDLVVLSACQTGVGDIQTGEGVFGLKRAFILSGARTVVMSLWSVPSKETTELMGSFYTKWAAGKSKAEALREAKLELMKENPNPFFWGAFVMVGDPGK